MSKTFPFTQLKDACEAVFASQSHFTMTLDHQEHWPNSFFMPEKLMHWGPATLECTLRDFVHINCSRYGLREDQFRIQITPIRWFLECPITEERTYYDSLDEAMIMEGADSWLKLQKLGIRWELNDVYQLYEPMLDDLDELANDI